MISKHKKRSYSVFDRLRNLFHARQGRLTSELLREPGRFGLGQVPADRVPDETTAMVCGYCSVGCGLNMHLRDGEAINLTPSMPYPVNRGTACPKGWEALRVLQSGDRATEPLLRDESGMTRPVSWDVAMRYMTARFHQIQNQYGNDSIAFLSTGQIATEEMALLGAVAKFGMGMIHGDGNTRQCMASAVVAYKQSFGFDAPPYSYQDLEESDCIVLIGANPCIAHPVLWERVTRNPHHPEIIVVDPRRTETAMLATLHIPVRPKGDLTLLYGLANLLIERDAIDREFIANHTNGFEEFAAFVREFPLERVSKATDVPPKVLCDFADRIARGKRVSFWWTMGVNQSHQGVKTAQAAINLALMTGSIGRPGTGANSITGQCNAMGSRLFSNTTNLFAGRDFTNETHRNEVARILGIPVERIPEKPSLAYDQILEAVRSGQIKALWIVATNPAHSWIEREKLREAFGKLEFLVVQDMYHSTETAQAADLLLPAAGWGEKEGTFINSERRIGVIKRVCRAPGQSLADFHIFKLAAHYYGCAELFEKWKSPEDVFEILTQLSEGRTCDISGISDYPMIDRAGGIQWPFPSNNPDRTTERRLFADGVFPHEDGRARFVFAEPVELTESNSGTFPFVLLTGRGSAAQWHTQTRTSKSEVLRKLHPADPYVEINPLDADARAIHDGEWTVVATPRGEIVVRAFLSPSVRPGQLFLPMHHETTNILTLSLFDCESRQPAYKGCAADVRAATPDDIRVREHSPSHRSIKGLRVLS